MGLRVTIMVSVPHLPLGLARVAEIMALAHSSLQALNRATWPVRLGVICVIPGLSAAQVAAKREARGTSRCINLVDWTVYVAMHVNHIDCRDA
jgi:hypothetical protein